MLVNSRDHLAGFRTEYLHLATALTAQASGELCQFTRKHRHALLEDQTSPVLQFFVGHILEAYRDRAAPSLPPGSLLFALTQ